MKKLIVFKIVLSVLLFVSCTAQKKVKTIPFPTEEVYFQNWVGGQQQTGGGTNFYIKFKKALPNDYKLNKIYFHHKEAIFENQNPTIYTAHFFYKPSKSDLILDQSPSQEYGNKAPQLIQPKFKLNQNEAILEFEINKKIQFYKISNIKEKELLAYPSAKPRN